MDADGALDVRAGSVRRSRVVLMFAVLASSPGEAKLPWGDGGKKAVRRGEHV